MPKCADISRWFASSRRRKPLLIKLPKCFEFWVCLPARSLTFLEIRPAPLSVPDHRTEIRNHTVDDQFEVGGMRRQGVVFCSSLETREKAAKNGHFSNDDIWWMGNGLRLWLGRRLGMEPAWNDLRCHFWWFNDCTFGILQELIGRLFNKFETNFVLFLFCKTFWMHLLDYDW